jgi:hypothetical protein
VWLRGLLTLAAGFEASLEIDLALVTDCICVGFFQARVLARFAVGRAVGIGRQYHWRYASRPDRIGSRLPFCYRSDPSARTARSNGKGPDGAERHAAKELFYFNFHEGSPTSLIAVWLQVRDNQKIAKDVGIDQKRLVSMAPKEFWMPTQKLLKATVLCTLAKNKLLFR